MMANDHIFELDESRSPFIRQDLQASRVERSNVKVAGASIGGEIDRGALLHSISLHISFDLVTTGSHTPLQSRKRSGELV